LWNLKFYTMIDLIQKAVAKGAKLYSNISGGKDGQAMTKVLLDWNFQIESLLHCDLGRTEWKESLQQCEKLSQRCNVPLTIVKRNDGKDLLDRWQDRMNKLQGTGKPFWSSSASRYCTSDMKRDPTNVFYNSTGHNFIISCEGIRAEESTARAKKEPLSLRSKMCSSYYDGMTVEQAIENFNPKFKLVLTWFPIFNFTVGDVWATFNMKTSDLQQARNFYYTSGTVAPWWPFHPAYVYGNERVSCAICVLASINDITNGARHNPELFQTLVQMEQQSGFTFKNDFSLQSINL